MGMTKRSIEESLEESKEILDEKVGWMLPPTEATIKTIIREALLQVAKANPEIWKHQQQMCKDTVVDWMLDRQKDWSDYLYTYIN